MATNKNNQIPENNEAQENTSHEVMQPAEPEKKDIYIERGNANEEPNFQVCVNGVMYLLPKGKTSAVPVAVYNEIMRSRRARELQDQRMDDLREAAQQP